MKILVTGSSGLIGRAVVRDGEARGDTMLCLVRRPPRGPREARWDPGAGTIDTGALEGHDAIVHLAGESLAEGRWTAEKKRRLWRSRVDATRLLAGAIAGLARPPRVLVQASAVGYYGDRGDERLVETSGKGRGFLADLAAAWESASDEARARTRVVQLRTGLVLARPGGVLRRLLPIFGAGVGGPIAGGRAWWSWIALRDHLDVVRFAIEHESVTGAVNATAPGAVTNAEFTRALAGVLRRPAVLPVPAFALRALYGEMADEMLLVSARVEPAALMRAGFRFRFETLRPALEDAVAGAERA